MAVDASNNLIISEDKDANNKWTPLKYDGTNWQPLGILNSTEVEEHYQIGLDNAGNVYLAVWHADAITNSSNLYYIARYNGTWTMVGPDDLASVSNTSSGMPFVVTPDGTIYSNFLLMSDLQNHNVRWNGSVWVQDVQQYTDGTGQVVSLDRPLESDPSGNIFSLGRQNSDKFVVSKGNGASWQNIGFPYDVFLPVQMILGASACDHAGNLYIATSVYNTATGNYEDIKVSKWDGSAWTILDGINANGVVNSLAVGTNGHVYAAGKFTNASGKNYVAEWNGSSWAELGGNNGLGANDEILSLATDTRGYVYAGGAFTDASGEAYVAVYRP